MDTTISTSVTSGTGREVQARHGNASACQNCGEPITPKHGSRRQRYCNGRCKDEARRNRNNAICGRARYPSGPVPRSVKNSHANSNGCKAGLAGRGSVDKALWQHIVTVEVTNGHHWSPSVSTDGVKSEVTMLRPRALREVAS